ncbi:SET domain-containing protein-lysine N-methyltransferase [Candidatus Uhrbacteria bacterium]|nr:SET domain-containing protein-lysine N-methyltransferase [Candidatus Uhrbacteria bacterium]
MSLEQPLKSRDVPPPEGIYYRRSPRPARYQNVFMGKVFEPPRDLLVENQTNRVRVDVAGEKGKGIFAKEAIAANGVVFCAHGTRYTMDERGDSCFDPDSGGAVACPTDSSPNAICVLSHTSASGQVFHDWLNPDPDNPLRYLNHSCNPNVGRVGSYMFKSLRDISAGEELTADYSTLEANPRWSLECKCKSPQCRKKIGSVQTLTLEQAKDLWGSMPKFVQKIYLRSLEGKELSEMQAIDVGKMREEMFANPL